MNEKSKERSEKLKTLMMWQTIAHRLGIEEAYTIGDYIRLQKLIFRAWSLIINDPLAFYNKNYSAAFKGWYVVSDDKMAETGRVGFTILGTYETNNAYKASKDALRVDISNLKADDDILDVALWRIYSAVKDVDLFLSKDKKALYIQKTLTKTFAVEGAPITIRRSLKEAEIEKIKSLIDACKGGFICTYPPE